MKETRKLPVKLTADEMALVQEQHSAEASAIKAIDDEKRESLAGFRHAKKPHVDEFNRLDEIKRTGVEERDVECEIRESLVNGQTEVVRLDTMEVVDTFVTGASVDDESDPKQPALPFAAPAAPILRCTGIDRDGMLHAITAEQADMIEMGRAAGETFVPVKMSETLTAYIIEVRRGKACDTCGIVAPHHRPECASMRLDALVDEMDDVARIEGLDTAAVAARIDAMTPVNDAPLVPAGEGSKPLVKLPKRGKRAESAANGAGE